MVKTTKPCEYCGTQFTRDLPTDPTKLGTNGRFCSGSCSAKARWAKKPGRDRRKYDRMPDHPLAPKSGLVPHSRRLLYDTIGTENVICHWCEQGLTWRVNRKGGRSTGSADVVVDHLDGNHLNDVIENLVPSCQSCNTIRGLIRGWAKRTGRPLTDLDP